MQLLIRKMQRIRHNRHLTRRQTRQRRLPQKRRAQPPRHAHKTNHRHTVDRDLTRPIAIHVVVHRAQRRGPRYIRQNRAPERRRHLEHAGRVVALPFPAPADKRDELLDDVGLDFLEVFKDGFVAAVRRDFLDVGDVVVVAGDSRHDV